MNTEDLLKRVDQLIEIGYKVLSTKKESDSSGIAWLDSAPMTGFRAAGLSFINYAYGNQHPYYEELKATQTVLYPAMLNAALKFLKLSNQK